MAGKPKTPMVRVEIDGETHFFGKCHAFVYGAWPIDSLRTRVHSAGGAIAKTVFVVTELYHRICAHAFCHQDGGKDGQAE